MRTVLEPELAEAFEAYAWAHPWASVYDMMVEAPGWVLVDDLLSGGDERALTRLVSRRFRDGLVRWEEQCPCWVVYAYRRLRVFGHPRVGAGLDRRADSPQIAARKTNIIESFLDWDSRERTTALLCVLSHGSEDSDSLPSTELWMSELFLSGTRPPSVLLPGWGEGEPFRPVALPPEAEDWKL